MRLIKLKDVLLFTGIFTLIAGAVVWTWLYRQSQGLTEFWYVVGMIVMGLGLVLLIGGVLRTQLRIRPSPHKHHRRN